MCSELHEHEANDVMHDDISFNVFSVITYLLFTSFLFYLEQSAEGYDYQGKTEAHESTKGTVILS